MRFIGSLSLFAILMVSLPAAVPAADKETRTDPDGNQYVAGEVFVRYAEHASEATIAEIESRHGLTLLARMEHLGIYHYELPQHVTVGDAISNLGALDSVQYAEPNSVHQVQALPNDPRFPNQWALHNTGQQVNGRVGSGDVDIDWPEAMDLHSAHGSVIVGVVDTGIAVAHPDLSPNVWLNTDEPLNGTDDDRNGFVDDRVGWNFIDGNNAPLDDRGHGTSVAGTIGAESDDGTGVAGVSRSVELMALRVADELREFGGPIVMASNFVAATTYAAKNGAQIINYSAATTLRTNVEAAQVAWLDSQGVLLIAAAGNGDFDSDPDGDNNDAAAIYPASYAAQNVVSVAATGRDDTLTPWSNFGANSVDIAAPGLDIDTADINRRIVLSEGFEGTAPGWTVNNGCTLGCPNWNLYADFFGNSWATDGSFDSFGLPANYLSFTDSWIESPWFSVIFGPVLEFRVWHELNLGDILSVEASTDGVNWFSIGEVSGFSASFCPDCSIFSGRRLFGDLTGFEGETLKIRFRLLSDGAFQADGTYVDDVRVWDVNDFSFDGTQFRLQSGTSFSAPLVAGVAAMVWAERPDLSHRQVRQIVLESVDPLPALSGKVATGGRLNARNAVDAAIRFVPEPASGWAMAAALGTLISLSASRNRGNGTT